MSKHLTKSKFVSSLQRCDKYAWLESYKSEYKSEPGEFVESLFDNGHKVGELAKTYFNVDVDVTSYFGEYLDIDCMLMNTRRHMHLGTKVIAEATFVCDGCLCSVDILERNDDGSYNIYEVKSSKQDTKKDKKLSCVKEKYIWDAAYQQFVLQKCGVKVDKVYVVLLAEHYVRGKDLELDKYFVRVDVTKHTTIRQDVVSEKVSELLITLNNSSEPKSVLHNNCGNCDYWKYCHKNITSPSPFDVYNLKFPTKLNLYEEGVSFFDVPIYKTDLKKPSLLQIEYYNRPNDAYIDTTAIQEFLNELVYPVYSLDFETYQAVVPEHEGISTYEQVPFQYSLHIIEDDTLKNVKEHHFSLYQLESSLNEKIILISTY